jgi:hypothetical protein
MKRLTVVMTGLAAALSLCGLTGRADAGLLGNPAGLIDAADDLSLIENVHCRPGRWHHNPNRWRRGDGCRRGGAVIVVPGRSRYVIRDGVRVRVGTGGGLRSRGTIGTDSRTTTTIRSGSSSDSGAATSTRSTTSGGAAPSGDRPAAGRGDRPAARGDRPAAGGGSDTTRQAPAQQQPSGNQPQPR